MVAKGGGVTICNILNIRETLMLKEIFTAQEVAKYLRIHPYTVKRSARAGKLPGFKVGGQWRFKKKNIEEGGK